MGKRRSARELALRTLFQIDVGGIPPDEAMELSFSASHLNEAGIAFARQLTKGALKHLARVDKLIAKYSLDWTLDRMTNVDRNLMRLAIFELLYLPDIPPSVTLDEAVELAKRYSTAESGRFVNGLLGNLVRHLDQELAEIPESERCDGETGSAAEQVP
jgi:N utilization substance protein B